MFNCITIPKICANINEQLIKNHKEKNELQKLRNELFGVHYC